MDQDTQSSTTPQEATPQPTPQDTMQSTPSRGNLSKGIRLTEEQMAKIEKMIISAYNANLIPEQTFTSFVFFAFDCAEARLNTELPETPQPEAQILTDRDYLGSLLRLNLEGWSRLEELKQYAATIGVIAKPNYALFTFYAFSCIAEQLKQRGQGILDVLPEPTLNSLGILALNCANEQLKQEWLRLKGFS
jgi:hypothetical protein